MYGKEMGLKLFFDIGSSPGFNRNRLWPFRFIWYFARFCTFIEMVKYPGIVVRANVFYHISCYPIETWSLSHFHECKGVIKLCLSNLSKSLSYSAMDWSFLHSDLFLWPICKLRASVSEVVGLLPGYGVTSAVTLVIECFSEFSILIVDQTFMLFVSNLLR